MNHTLENANEYIELWKTTLAEKFNRFLEILMNSLSYHSRMPLDHHRMESGLNKKAPDRNRVQP